MELVQPMVVVGNNSIFSTITSAGGGQGRGNPGVSGGNGGSGGGGAGEGGTAPGGTGNTPRYNSSSRN